MATKNSIDSNIPVEISKGGTNASSFSTTYGTVYYDSSSLATVASVGASSQVLTSNGALSAPTFQDSGGATISVGFNSYSIVGILPLLTGDGTVVTATYDTEDFDIGGDYNNVTYTFTAPSAGKYIFNYSSRLGQALVSHKELVYSLVTSNRNYRSVSGMFNIWHQKYGYKVVTLTTICDMDASDTAYVTYMVSGGAKQIQQEGTLRLWNYFTGYKLL